MRRKKIENSNIVKVVSWRFTESGVECYRIKYLDISKKPVPDVEKVYD